MPAFKITFLDGYSFIETDHNIEYWQHGFVMPLYHGYDWKKTKKELINKYTY